MREKQLLAEIARLQKIVNKQKLEIQRLTGNSSKRTIRMDGGSLD